MIQDTNSGQPATRWARRNVTYEKGLLLSKSWPGTPVEARRLLAVNRGLAAEVGDKQWGELTEDEKALLETGKLPETALLIPKEEPVAPPATDVLQVQIETLTKQVKSLNEQFIRLRNEHNTHVLHHDTPQTPSRGAVR